MRSVSRILSATVLIGVNASLLFAGATVRRGDGDFPTPPPVQRGDGAFPTSPLTRGDGDFPTPPPMHAIAIAG